MCGIAGILSLKKYTFERNSSTKDLKSMLAKISHRGPDESGTAEGDDFAIGNVRLNIIGKELGKQPSRNQGTVLVYNGEIYNYSKLAISNKIKNNGSDTFVLSKLLNARSMDILTELNGMFAFCYITKDSIYLVRDQLGIKPLFYTFLNNSLYFSSEMKSFLGITDLEINVSKTFVSLETEIGEKTIFKNIFQIQPGTYIKIDRKSKKVKKIKYYSLPKNTNNLPYETLKDQLRYLITDAVDIRTKTNEKFAAYVSGGIDSSIVALLSKPNYLFTYLPDSSNSINEENYADLLSASLPSSKLIKIRSKQDMFLKNFIHMIYINDGPTTSFASYSQFVLSQKLNKANIRIALSGIGADEFYNGYVRHAIAALEPKFYKDTIFHSYEMLLQKSGVLHHSALPKSEIYMNLLSRNSPLDNETRSSFLMMTKSYPNLLSAFSAADSKYTLPPLLHIDDHINMAFSIESRSPFLDHRVVEFGISLPDNYKIFCDPTKNKIITKHLLREAFKDILPARIYSRKEKIGFTSNVVDLLQINMKFMVEVSLNILRFAFPDNRYFYSNDDNLGKFSRWEYQIVQLAITYLLFTKKYSEEEIFEYFQKNMPA